MNIFYDNVQYSFTCVLARLFLMWWDIELTEITHMFTCLMFHKRI